MSKKTADQFFAGYSLRIVEIELSNGNMVFVKEMPASLINKIARLNNVKLKKSNNTDLQTKELATVFANCIVDKEGVRVFEDTHVERITENISFKDLLTVFKEASLKDEDDVDEDVKD